MQRKWSDNINILNGIFQGTNVAQTFFVLYINDILKIPHELISFLFADDFQAIFEVDLKDLKRGISLVNSDLQRINDWIISRGLQLNVLKSKAMIIGTKNRISKIDFNLIERLRISGENLEYCKTIKNLGVIFDENLTFEAENNSKIQKAYGVLNRIRHTRNTVPNYVKRDIATALVDPILDYGNVVTYGWGVHGTGNDENRILVADNDKIRYVYSLKRHEHISEYRSKLNTLTPEGRAKIQSACLIYKHLNGQSPAYFNDLIVVQNTSTRSNGQLRVNKPRTTFDMRAFGYSAILFWNSVPLEIQNSVSLCKFKENIKSWIRSNRE